LDATTAVLPVLSVITSISMDHMKYLGDTIEKIAAEKAGIIMPGVPVVYDRNSAAAEAVILRKAAGCGSRAYGVSPDEGERRFPFLRVPYMRENAAVARQAFLLLGFADDGAFEKAAAVTYWAGRMDEIEPGVFLDGAHNADGIRAFAEAAADILQRRQKTAVLLISAVSDKDIASMCTEIGRHLQPARVYTARLSDSRAADEDVIAGNLRRALGCTVTEKGTVHEAFASALAGRSGDEILFCTGSLYLVGELLKERKEIK
jgi:dihydrofolate synthase/folylpolyglutamate synthase